MAFLTGGESPEQHAESAWTSDGEVTCRRARPNVARVGECRQDSHGCDADGTGFSPPRLAVEDGQLRHSVRADDDGLESDGDPVLDASDGLGGRSWRKR